MKKILTGLAMILSVAAMNAQDEAVYTHYLLNKPLINPAATGFGDKYQLFFNYRNAWTGFPGAPKTYALSFNGPVGDKLGLGATLMQENIAQMSRFRGQLSYAFRYRIENVQMSIGLSTELQQIRVSSQAGNTLIDPSDNTLNSYVDGQRLFDAALGVYGVYKENLFFGLSAPNLIRARLDDVPGAKSGESSFLKSALALVGYRFKMDEFTLEPSMLVGKALNTPFIADFNLRSSFLNETLLTGISYRAGLWKALSFMVGAKVGGLQLAYSYDYSFQTFQNYNGGSHEVTLSFEFERKAKKIDRKKKYRN